MGNSVSMYDVRLDGEVITKPPKPVVEALQWYMKDHNTLIVMRKAEIADSEKKSNNTLAIDESVKRLEDAINLQRDKISEAINSTVNAFNSQVNDLRDSIDKITTSPQVDIGSMKTTIDVLAGRVNDMSIALPATLTDRFNNQTDRLVDTITETLKPKESLNVTIKGAAYELEVTQQFDSLGIPTLSIERISNEKNECCDIHVMDTANNILFAIECKNYTQSVPRKEVDKFYRDLKNIRNSEEFKDKTVVGMFLSKQSSIVGHGMLDVDEDGNIFLAGDYNNPLMWRTVLLYNARLKARSVTVPEPAENTSHLDVLLKVYESMKDMDMLAEIVAKNITRANEMLKDLKGMADRIKPVSEIIDQFATIYGFTKPAPKQKQRKSKKDSDNTEHIETEPLSLSDSDGEKHNETPVKRKYTKREKKSPVEVVPVQKDTHGTIGWSDDE